MRNSISSYNTLIVTHSISHSFHALTKEISTSMNARNFSDTWTCLTASKMAWLVRFVKEAWLARIENISFSDYN